eukprot:scaffold2425_cov76-Skeletonema_dohrnii-CCMP3373.AAC.4
MSQPPYKALSSSALCMQSVDLSITYTEQLLSYNSTTTTLPRTSSYTIAITRTNSCEGYSYNEK